jgi:hypothetical protein
METKISERNAKTADITPIRKHLPTYLSVISSGFDNGKIFNVDHTATDRIQSAGMLLCETIPNF